MGKLGSGAVSEQEAYDCLVLAWKLYQVTGSKQAGGIFAAVNWVTRSDSQVAPVTERADPVSWARVRGESWAAVCVAVGTVPDISDWAWFGAVPQPIRDVDPYWAHEAW